MSFSFSITPKELLDDKGISFKPHGSFLSVKVCPNCEGGKDKAKYTFGVHSVDGNYFCLRTSCGFKGSFWSLMEFYGYDPRKFIVKSNKIGTVPTKQKKKGYIYGR